MDKVIYKQTESLFPKESIDVLEQGLLDYDEVLLQRLLKDQTTKNNIRWGCDDYKDKGEGFKAKDEMFPRLVTGIYTRLIQPRSAKSREEQDRRTRGKAEVFTSSWICNKQNNLIDEAWFGKSCVFNIETNESWESVEEVIDFPNVKGKTWQDYVEANRLEVTCGEAPYLVSRYDTVTGRIIPIKSRIGLLDRKMRIVKENTKNREEWLIWAEKAFQSIYGYDYQGDNVLLARENLLYSYVDYHFDKFECDPDQKQLRRIAHIISWNIFQMDGIKMTSPFTKNEEQLTMDMFLELESRPGQMVIEEITPEIPCRVMDWKANKSIEFKSLMKGDC